jgi:WD40 repeat protein
MVTLTALVSYATLQRSRANRMNVQLENQLTTSTIDSGRLLSLTGNLPNAEELVWRELFKHPDSRHARWTLWDIYSRDPSLWARIVHEGGTQTLRFSPDNRRIVTGGRQDGLVRLIDVASGDTLRTMTSVPQSGIRRTFFIEGGKAILSASDDGSLRIWEADTGRLRREFVKAIPKLQDLALTADGMSAVAVAEGTVHQWSLANGQMVASFPELATRVFSVATSPRSSLVLAGSNDGTVTAFDLDRRVRLWQGNPRQGQVLSVAIAPDDRVMASGSADGILTIWDGPTGAALKSMPAENGRVRSLVFLRSRKSLAVGGVWRTRLWNLEDLAQPPRDLGGSEGITELHVGPDDRYLATCSGGDGKVRLWDLQADARTDRWSAHSGRVVGLELAPDGGWFMTVSGDGVLQWQPGRTSRTLSLQSQTPMYAVAVSSGSQWLATVGNQRGHVWDSQTGRLIVDLPDSKSARAVIFSDDDRKIHVGEPDGALATWDWIDGAARGPRRVPADGLDVTALAARRGRVFAAHVNRLVAEIDAESGREVRRFTTTASPQSIAVSPDGRSLASGTFTGTVFLWDLENGRTTELKGQTRLVNGIDFSPDSRILASGSRDGTTRLWDVETGVWLATVASRIPGAERVRFFPDGRRLAIGYEDGEVEIRDLQYFFRYAAGHAGYQLRLLTDKGESFPRSADVIAWSRGILQDPRAGK